MNPVVRDALAQELLRQRAVLVGEVVDTEADLHTLAEDREIELEERAQEEREARLLVQFDDREKYEIAEIDAALRRIAEDTYGICEGCRESIAEARLQALPATRFCVACAQAQETPLVSPPPEED
jgi:DnaK suppressor protein